MFAIFTGTVNGLTNLVVLVAGIELRVVFESANHFWVFDLDRGVFEAVEGEGSNWGDQIIEQSGRNLQRGAAYTVSEVTMQMVDYKLSPAV